MDSMSANYQEIKQLESDYDSRCKNVLLYFNRKCNKTWGLSDIEDEYTLNALEIVKEFHSVKLSTEVAYAGMVKMREEAFSFHVDWLSIVGFLMGTANDLKDSDLSTKAGRNEATLKTLKNLIKVLFKSIKELKNEEKCICFVLSDLISRNKKFVSVGEVKAYLSPADRFGENREFLCPFSFECERKNAENKQLCAFYDPDLLLKNILPELVKKEMIIIEGDIIKNGKFVG